MLRHEFESHLRSVAVSGRNGTRAGPTPNDARCPCGHVFHSFSFTPSVILCADFCYTWATAKNDVLVKIMVLTILLKKNILPTFQYVLPADTAFPCRHVVPVNILFHGWPGLNGSAFQFI